MSTVAYDPLKALYRLWDAASGYRSAVGSGMVGDASHARRGGFHIGRAFQPSSNYSVIRPDDKGGPADSTTAIDMSMNAKDMTTCSTHLRAVWRDKSDARRKYINAFNGWFGSGDPIRFDFVTGKKSRASADHKWHIHLEIRRKWCLSKVAHDAVLSILRGQSKADYLKSIGIAAPARPAVAGKPASVPVPPFNGASLKRGSRGPAVLLYQKRMLARGYKSIGTPDADFGPKTQKVTVTFQRLCKVKADGEVGRITWPLPWTRPL